MRVINAYAGFEENCLVVDGVGNLQRSVHVRRAEDRQALELIARGDDVLLHLYDRRSVGATRDVHLDYRVCTFDGVLNRHKPSLPTVGVQ
jgi:hypothetical protein